ncbi:MATE family efflux transporter [Gammaproteobacteria bacterium]|nr:MATE family efflux transporter [Gammaproteobacteria bacterium]
MHAFEFKKLIQIGIPILGSQLSYMLMGTTDTIVAGRASSADLAGLGVGSAIFNTIWFLIAGVIFAVTPIVAQLYGSKKYEKIGKKLREALWISFFLGLAVCIILFFMGNFLSYLPIDNSITSISSSYLKALSVGIIFMTIFTTLRCYSEGMALTRPVFYIAFFGMLLNIPLDIIFVYGYFGIPKLGGVGCGIATTLVSFLMMLTLIFYIHLSKNYSSTKPFSEFTPPSLETTKEIFKLGIPIGFGIFIELSMFSGAALILGSLGETIVAGHYIALNIASLFFMLPLSIGLAAATRVGNLVGEDNYAQAKIASYSTIYLCIIGSIMTCLTILLVRDQIVYLYSNDLNAINIATSLLIFAAIFQLPDGIQMAAVGSLRGFKDTFAPMILLFISYWMFAIPAGYFLTMYGFSEPFGAAGMWVGMIIGLTIFSILSILRLRWVIKKKLFFKFNDREPLPL